MRRDERGYIVVETIGSFLLFVLAVTSILSLINIVAVQARVHYAITQAAQTVSMYCYVLDVTGAADHLVASAGQAQTVQVESDAFKENLNGLLDGLESLDPDQVGAKGQAALDQVQGWADDVSAAWQISCARYPFSPSVSSARDLGSNMLRSPAASTAPTYPCVSVCATRSRYRSAPWLKFFQDRSSSSSALAADVP